MPYCYFFCFPQLNYNPLFASIQCRTKIFQHEPCLVELFLDHLKDCDFLPLYELFTNIDDSLIHGVDIYNETLCVMNGGYVLSLLRALNKKLCAVHLNDLEKGFLRYVVRISI